MLQTSSVIRYTSKIFIVLKTKRLSDETTIMNILDVFFKVLVLNTMVWQGDKAYRQELTHHKSHLVSQNTSDIASEADLFPNKVKDLHGHPLTLVQMHSSLYSVIVKEKDGRLRLDGTTEYLLDLILQRLNATYELKQVYSPDEILESFNDGSGDFSLNKLSPFWESFLGTCDFLGTMESDSFRVMVRFGGKNNVARRSFFTAEICINFLIILITSLLYSILFDTSQRPFVLNIFNFTRILLQTPAVMKVQTSSSRIFLTAVLLFCLVQSVSITTLITSRMVTYLPDSGINSTQDIVDANISIYGNSYSVSVIKDLDVGLDQRFIDRLEVVEEFPWNLNTTKEFAFVVNTVEFRRFFELVTYNDRYDKHRFMLFPGHLAEFPVNFVFPKNSPITEAVQRIYTRTKEAGLEERWSLVKLNQMKDWHYFKHEYSGLTAEEYLNVTFVFEYFVIGHLFAIIAFVCENIVGRRFRWPAKEQEPEVILPYCN